MKSSVLYRALSNELIIDAHAHFGFYYNFPIPFGEWSDCVQTAKRLNIGHILASSTLAIANDVASGNLELLDTVDKFSSLLSPYLVYKPNFPEYLPQLIHISEKRNIHTFKLPDDGNDLPYNNDSYLPFYEWADAHGAVILFHTFGKVHLVPIMDIAGRFKNLTCLLAHAGIVDETLYVDAVKRFENIQLELANSWAWFGLIERLVNKVGAERILFGSDMPFLSPEQQLGRIVMARISDEDRRKILGLNAQTLFDL